MTAWEHLSESNEHFTPEYIIEAARERGERGERGDAGRGRGIISGLPTMSVAGVCRSRDMRGNFATKSKSRRILRE